MLNISVSLGKKLNKFKTQHKKRKKKKQQKKALK